MRKFLLATALCAFAAGGAQAEEADGPGPNLVLEIGGAGFEGKPGKVVIDLYEDAAPQHVKRIVQLANEHAYDDVNFHRVIAGFMAQTGDVQFGKRDGADASMAGMGGSKYPDLPAEFSDKPFVRGTVGMARSSDPNSANSQFFIMFASAPHLDGQYTVVGKVIEGMDVVDKIRKGNPGANGLVSDPDFIQSATID